MTNEIEFFRCGTCHRYFHSEQAILDHQSLFSRLHAHDPEIGEHDGQPWRTVTLRVGESLELGAEWARLVAIDNDPDEPLIVETPSSHRFRSNARMSTRALAEHLSGSRVVDLDHVRAFAAAINLGECIDGENYEVDINAYIEARYKHWHGGEEGRFAVEMAQLQAMLGILAFNAARENGR